MAPCRIFGLFDQVAYDLGVERRQNPRSSDLVDLNEASIPQNFNMAVDPSVVHSQVACDRSYVKGFLAIHKHEQYAKSNRISECPEHYGSWLEIFGSGHSNNQPNPKAE